MAFNYNKPTRFGVDAAYHIVSAIHVYIEERVAHIDVSGYAAEGADQPLLNMQVELSGDNYPFDDGNITTEIAEAAVQKLPEYGGIGGQ